jgi:hypothetical protein
MPLTKLQVDVRISFIILHQLSYTCVFVFFQTVWLTDLIKHTSVPFVNQLFPAAVVLAGMLKTPNIFVSFHNIWTKHVNFGIYLEEFQR